MRKGIVILLMVVTAAGMLAGSCVRSSQGGVRTPSADSTSGRAVILFNSPEHDFGRVKAGERVGCFFSFTNSGDADLVITAVSASCGCTVPKFDKKPLPPGENGVIEVVFDTSGREGVQSKTIMVQSNAENNITILRIIAEVIPHSAYLSEKK